MSEDSVSSSTPSDRTRIGWWQRCARSSDRMLLRRMPEFALFPSDQARVKAIKELDQELERTRAFKRFIAWTVIGAVILANASFCLAPMLWPWRVRGIGGIVAAVVGLTAAVIIILGWRHSVAKRLRHKLIELGVPVCRQCGYPLRGLKASASTHCPECGWLFDEGVRLLMERGDHAA